MNQRAPITNGGFRPGAGRRKVAGGVALAVLLLLAVAVGSLTGLMLVYSVNLPQIDDLTRYRPDTTTELYDIHGRIFGSFALQRRVLVNYTDLSPLLRQAVISIEDKNFESHWGVNFFRVLGAAYHDLTSKSRAQGASTLTMQLARNLFLSNERTFGRKLQEVLLSIQIEHTFTKQQIFTLYANQIYLGHGVYGFEAGSEYYFSKHAKDLTLPEAALLAGLPKGPSEYDPVVNPDKAFRRRNMVVNAMLEDGKITAAQANGARSAPLGLHIQPPPNSAAPWFVEEVRRELERKLGPDQVHEAGLKVYTTLDLDLQQAANRAVLDGLTAYERRHGWRGHLLNVIAGGIGMEGFKHPDWIVPPQPGAYVHALVTGVLPYQATARIGNEQLVLTPDDWAWTGFKTADGFLKTGDIIYVHLREQDGNILRGTLEEDTGVQGSLMAMDNVTGDVLAMVGGRDFNLSQFNRATQAERQTGSSFKPYVYTAAIEDGATPEEKILDTPVSFGNYTPHDYEGNYLGSITLLKAFADSRNIPALRLAERVGMKKVIDVAHQFGITANIPAYLPVALGSVEVTLEQQMAAYAAFPNDGIRIASRLIRRVTTADGAPLMEDTPEVTEATSARTARTMMVLLREVTRSGTAKDAAVLNHPIGGKTGTTSDFTDAWFIGFSPSTTCGVWVGYDNRESLGDKETGAKTALPIWIDFMRAAIAGKDDETFPGDQKSSPMRLAQAAVKLPAHAIH
ncbi:PBP1A family penicillin-binding protein [Alloacidobacterium sp.]|uniref:penicillin-binding protein 1A n=1 Tax=Alloacidobacterium sp. TaxID=2951999 RepID=UPI002D6D6BA4|nr:PBP1A family penicillin-binding protein [Alloacidobacterium sp.]HYK36930.1 PBP1A family penicillin-binding protein [Alloacidobacterium sp.]